MKCADPVLCYLDGKGNRKFRHFSIARRSIHGIPKSHIVFDCGRCLHCRKKRAYELACRCVLHASLYKENSFLTLTYDEKKKGYHNELEYSDIQKFKKRLRSFVARNQRKTIELFNVHEYGKNGKKHWHLIAFNYKPPDGEFLKYASSGEPLYTSKSLSRLWSHGLVSFGDVSAASAMYTAQYSQKDVKNGNLTNGKKSLSKHSGIGRKYFEQHFRQILTLGYVPIGNAKLPVPRYFQKLAKKHWAWFYERSLFYDNAQRSAVFRPFTRGSTPNLELANLWPVFSLLRSNKISELESSWLDTIEQFLTSGEDPGFIKSNDNALYDLKRKNTKEVF